MSESDRPASNVPTDTAAVDVQISELFTPLTIDLNDLEFAIKNRPLLAHYTSIDTLEKIMATDELWLSNPLFMNDLQEARFGVQQGAKYS